jgi:UDP-perosamine 4-acetyltransferase
MPEEGLVVVGTGDHARVVIDLARAAGLAVAGCVAMEAHAAVSVGDMAVVGTLDEPAAWAAPGRRFTVAIGHTAHRRAAFERCVSLGLEPIALVHPRATLLGGATIGAGSHACANSVIGVDARIGSDSIVNTGAIVDHDGRIGDHVLIGPGARLAGRVVVEDGAWVGIGATVREGIRIGESSLVAAGAVVVDDVPAGARVAGVPARPMAARTAVGDR